MAKSPLVNCYRALNGACDFSSMTFVIVTDNEIEKKKTEGLQKSSRESDIPLWLYGSCGFREVGILEDICKFIALLFKQVKGALGKIRFI